MRDIVALGLAGFFWVLVIIMALNVVKLVLPVLWPDLFIR